MTTSVPRAIVGSNSWLTARNRRRTRLRTTAPPTAFGTMNPNRLGQGSRRSSTCMTVCSMPTRRPRRVAARKSRDRVTRLALASKGRSGGELVATLATPSREDGAACAGAHTKAEAVHLGTATVVRLEGSLAHSGLSKAQLRRPVEGWPRGGPDSIALGAASTG